MKPRTDGDRYERTARRMSLTYAAVSAVLGSAAAWTAALSAEIRPLIPSAFVGLSTGLTAWLGGYMLWMDHKARQFAPPPPGWNPVSTYQKSWRVPALPQTVTMIDRDGRDVLMTEVLEPKRMYKFCAWILSGRKHFTNDDLTPKRVLMSDRELRLLRDSFIRHGWGRWVDQNTPRLGVEITDLGRKKMLDFLHSPAPKTVSRGRAR